MSFKLSAITYLDAGILVVNKDGDAVILPLGASPSANELWISTDDRIAHARKRTLVSDAIKSIDYFGRDFLFYARLLTREGESILDSIARLASRIFTIASRKMGVSESDLMSRMRVSHVFPSAMSSFYKPSMNLYVDGDDDLLQELDHAGVIQDRASRKDSGVVFFQLEPHYLLSMMQEVRLPSGVLREVYFQSANDLAAWLTNSGRPFLLEVSFVAVSKSLKGIHKPGYFLKRQWVSYASYKVLLQHAKMKIERCLVADYHELAGKYINVKFDQVDTLSVSSGVFAGCVIDSMITSSRAQFEDDSSRIARRFWFSSALRAIMTDVSILLSKKGLDVHSFSAGSICIDAKDIDVKSLVSVAYEQNCEIIEK